MSLYMTQKYTFSLICIFKLDEYFFRKEFKQAYDFKSQIDGVGGRGSGGLRRWGLGARGAAQLVKLLLCKHEPLNSGSQHLQKVGCDDLHAQS